MYGYLWGALPGPRPVKALLAIVLVVAVVLLLMEFVFPWVSEHMPTPTSPYRAPVQVGRHRHEARLAPEGAVLQRTRRTYDDSGVSMQTSFRVCRNGSPS